jgi:hypothetical protein
MLVWGSYGLLECTVYVLKVNSNNKIPNCCFQPFEVKMNRRDGKCKNKKSFDINRQLDININC